MTITLQILPFSNYSFTKMFSWRPPRYFQNMPKSKFERTRKKLHILVEGEDVPPPIKHFKVMILQKLGFRCLINRYM